LFKKNNTSLSSFQDIIAFLADYFFNAGFVLDD